MSQRLVTWSRMALLIASARSAYASTINWLVSSGLDRACDPRHEKSTSVAKSLLRIQSASSGPVGRPADALIPAPTSGTGIVEGLRSAEIGSPGHGDVTSMSANDGPLCLCVVR